LKREANLAYSQVQFNYDDGDVESKAIGPKLSTDVQAENDDDDDNEPFTPHVDLKLPPEMEVPPTIKLNQIIEKTAKFIASQGPQMEILLKTKQASNAQFLFLNHDGQYNSYYKHILSMMRNKTYPVLLLDTQNNGKDNNNINNGSGSGSSSNVTDKSNEIKDENVSSTSTVVIPKIQYKPSADCAYTQLISKITKAPISELERKQQQEQERQKQMNNDTNNVVKPSSAGLLGLGHYNSDSDNDESASDNENECEREEQENESNFKGIIPPSDIQIVIDKTAVYVAKNGTDFEQKLMCKDDARFKFLHANNEFHRYYKMKVRSYQANLPTSNNKNNNNINNPSNAVSTTTSNSSSAHVQNNNNKNHSYQMTKTTNLEKEIVVMPKAPPAPVSFSIKPKEEKKTTLKATTMVNSDDDDDGEKSGRNNVNNVVAGSDVPEAPSPPQITSVEEELERQVDIINAEREQKLAKERLNDKLLNAAREKLGLLPKEKMLKQIERRKRAMKFINQIKGKSPQ
jgi:hypothetical protein